MKQLEKVKVEKIIHKIQKKIFDENDVDGLFMKMRAYSKDFKVFREIADFVAHNDERNKGETKESLKAMYYSMRYFTEYVSPQKELDISKPFPIWIKDLIKYQIDKINKDKLYEKHKILPSRLKTRVDKGFKDNKTLKTTQLINKKLSMETLSAISYVMGFIISKPAYNQNEIIDELIGVLNKNQVEFIEDKIRDSGDRIILCILLLLHNTEFNYDGHKKGYSTVSAEQLSIFHDTKFVDIEENPVEMPKQSFGKIQVNGYITIKNKGQDVTVSYSIMSTNLKAEEYCDRSLFFIEKVNEEASIFHKKLSFDGDLCITQDFQLAKID